MSKKMMAEFFDGFMSMAAVSAFIGARYKGGGITGDANLDRQIANLGGGMALTFAYRYYTHATAPQNNDEQQRQIASRNYGRYMEDIVFSPAAIAGALVALALVEYMCSLAPHAHQGYVRYLSGVSVFSGAGIVFGLAWLFKLYCTKDQPACGQDNQHPGPDVAPS